ncbi:MAG TPA: hypothetical protein VMS08_03620 [Candidatus Saccharimonadia bacterium]|nr:hypothetical protein [Candidatus Saccharimonadia bacterium]
MASKPQKTKPIQEDLDGLTIEQVTGIVELGKGACTDEQARVPPGTLSSLIKQGYAVKVKGTKGRVGYAPTEAGRAKAREWLISGLARRAAAQQTREPRAKQQRSTGKLPGHLTIAALKEANPSRAGTKAHDYYTLIQKGGTVETYLQAGGAMAYLTWFIDRGMASAT